MLSANTFGKPKEFGLKESEVWTIHTDEAGEITTKGCGMIRRTRFDNQEG
jgi:hypothetical protein